MVGVVGHRGAAGHAPENTLGGFERAVEIGVDAVEFDVRESADGVAVVIHDATVDRTTDGVGAVSELTLDDLRTLNAGDGAVIPTLEETLDLLADHGVGIRVELKERGLGADVVAALEERGLAARTSVVSFDPEAIAEIDDGRGAAITRSLTTADPDEALFDAASDLGCSWVGINHEAADREVVDAARDRGFEVGLWTPNEPREIEAALALDPDAVTSDYPDRVLARL